MVLVLALCPSAAGAEVATASVTVNLTLGTRTSLRVSTHVLRFEVTQPGADATAALDFTAGARMSSGSDVVLTMEPLRDVGGPGGAADVETALTFTGEGDGVLAGSVAMSQGTVVGRWQGSGVREGRVLFTLRANAAGSYSLPVRFVLSTP
jgi:hypothetical protein